MGLFHKAAKISVCIPVYGTEDLLEKCLDSVAAQMAPEGVKDFLEVVVVDDCSPQGTAEEIVKRFRKTSGMKVQFLRHRENKGLVEARRSAVYEAKGDYIFNLDSDDELPPDALRVLYEKAVESGADMVHGSAEVFFCDESAVVAEVGAARMEAYRDYRRKMVQNVYEGILAGGDILDAYLVNGKLNGFLWGKLFKRELYLEAFEHIPPIFNTMAEDVVQFVWLAHLARSYVGVKDCVYHYFIDSGVSSNKAIVDLSSWERVCSTASVFTALFSEMMGSVEVAVDGRGCDGESEVAVGEQSCSGEGVVAIGEQSCSGEGDAAIGGESSVPDFTEAQLAGIKQMCRGYLINNLEQFNKVVAPEIKTEAYAMLCEYWGEDFVKTMESQK